MDEYNEAFFQGLREGSLRSAMVIVPLVVDLIRPRSVVDVGCGTGAWLTTFAFHGVEDYLGVDAFTPAGLLEIPPDRFMQADLTRPLALGRSFDLAVALEIAEHLPDSAAECFVESLTGLAPAVLFSAAIPGQGGTGHLNERWPEYWSGLFAAAGFDPIDALRPRIWHDERVEVWYAQNTFLYVARGAQGNFPGIAACRVGLGSAARSGASAAVRGARPSARRNDASPRRGDGPGAGPERDADERAAEAPRRGGGADGPARTLPIHVRAEQHVCAVPTFARSRVS